MATAASLESFVQLNASFGAFICQPSQNIMSLYFNSQMISLSPEISKQARSPMPEIHRLQGYYVFGAS